MSGTPETGGEEGETLAVGRLARAKTRQLLRVLVPDGRTSLVLVVLIFFVWLATGIYKVQPDEAGIVQRFGKFTYATGVGLHYHLPFPIETVLQPKITKINQLQIGGRSLGDSSSRSSNQMLTGDENIVEADCTIFWRIKDATQYLFKVNDPDGTLRVAAESSVREVVARNQIQSALSDKRQQIAEDIRTTLQSHLDEYQIGIAVTQVQLQRVEPPPAVIDAFNDVQRARSDQERARNEAEAYRNDILPRARGEAEKILREAEAYKAQVIDNAQGEAASFLALYKAYKLAPDVTGWRLYLDAVDQMLRKASRVIVDSSGKGMSSVLPVMSVDGRAVSGAAAVKSIASQPLASGPIAGPGAGQTLGQTGGVQP